MSNEQKQKLKDYRKEYYKKYYAEKKLNNKRVLCQNDFACVLISIKIILSFC